MSSLPDPVARVAAFLAEAKVEARLQEFPEGTGTAAEAAEAAGCRLDQIVKSLVFAHDGGFVLALVPGDKRADRAKVAAAAGFEKAKVAGPDEVRQATGFEPGAVAPFALATPLNVLVDRALLVHDVVWIGAGSERHVAALAPADLVRLARGRAADLAAEEG